MILTMIIYADSTCPYWSQLLSLISCLLIFYLTERLSDDSRGSLSVHFDSSTNIYNFHDSACFVDPSVTFFCTWQSWLSIQKLFWSQGNVLLSKLIGAGHSQRRNLKSSKLILPSEVTGESYPSSPSTLSDGTPLFRRTYLIWCLKV